MTTQKSQQLKKPLGLTREMYRRAVIDSITKLNPRLMVRNPVMFVVEVGSILTSALWIQALFGQGEAAGWYIGSVALWLWFTVLFANFSEALAEGRGKAQADALRRARQETKAKRLKSPKHGSPFEVVTSTLLQKGDAFLVESGETIAVDGEVIEGIASVDESAITGESAPVIRESGGDRSAVTGGTRVLSDWLIIRATTEIGGGFLDRMIRLIEGAKRQKTPNEIALNIFLAAFTIIFLMVCVTLLPYSLFSVHAAGQGTPVTVTVLVALLVCLIPTTIGGLCLPDRDRRAWPDDRHNVIATSGRAVEAAGDVDVLLLDKTGTVTLGNRMATEFIPAPGISQDRLADAAQLASLADETPEGRSIVILAKEKYGLRGRDIQQIAAQFVPFTAQTRMSGVDIQTNGRTSFRSIRKGATDAIKKFIEQHGGRFPAQAEEIVQAISRRGGTPLIVAENGEVLGVVHLKDIVKGGIKERFAQLGKWESKP